jgi:heat shock protein HslJ
MKNWIRATTAALCLIALAAPADAKKRAQPEGGEQQQKHGDEGNAGFQRYKPFPHNLVYNLKEINGRTPSVEIWLRIDSTGRAAGFSGCKNFSGVFIVGAERLGPRAMPAVTDQKCDPAAQAMERDFWGIMASGPYWDTQGDSLIIKGLKGGEMRFTRSLL